MIVYSQPEKRYVQSQSAHKRSDTQVLTLRTEPVERKQQNGNTNDPSTGSPMKTLLRILLPLTQHQVENFSRRIFDDRC